MGVLRRDLLVRKRRNRHTVAGVLNGYGAKSPISVKIEKGVFVQISCLVHLGSTKLDIERVRVSEVFDLHGLNDLSKKALCTVLLSGERITTNGALFGSALPPAAKARD